MLEQLHLKNFTPKVPLSFQEAPEEVFTLKTCQRQLLMTWGKLETGGEGGVEYKGIAAYRYLLGVICGMQSKVLAESEIMAQFKRAYWDYLEFSERQSSLIRVLEKLLKDAKEIRCRYLEGVGQKTYAAITRKLIFEQTLPKRILIIGSGLLAKDMVNQFKKKVDQIYISSRNQEKIQEFCRYDLTYPLEWSDKELYLEFPFIVNAVGVSGLTLLDDDFFQLWRKRHDRLLFVDLGEPSSIVTDLGREEGVIRLGDVIERSMIREQEKQKKIQLAGEAIDEFSAKRGGRLV